MAKKVIVKLSHGPDAGKSVPCDERIAEQLVAAGRGKIVGEAPEEKVAAPAKAKAPKAPAKSKGSEPPPSEEEAPEEEPAPERNLVGDEQAEEV